jgi:hypothetical protein
MWSNWRFNADKNAPHFCRLTLALGFWQTPAFASLVLKKEKVEVAWIF